MAVRAAVSRGGWASSLLRPVALLPHSRPLVLHSHRTLPTSSLPVSSSSSCSSSLVTPPLSSSSSSSSGSPVRWHSQLFARRKGPKYAGDSTRPTERSRPFTMAQLLTTDAPPTLTPEQEVLLNRLPRSSSSDSGTVGDWRAERLRAISSALPLVDGEEEVSPDSDGEENDNEDLSAFDDDGTGDRPRQKPRVERDNYDDEPTEQPLRTEPVPAGPLRIHHQFKDGSRPRWHIYFDHNDEPFAPHSASAPAIRVPRHDEQGRARATGRRKSSTARVWIKPGSGLMVINTRLATDYFHPQERGIISRAFRVTDTIGQFDLFAKVEGGGKTGQAGAVLHGCARALQNYNPFYRPQLKACGFLTRDSRMVETKKFGRKKARKRFQWHKR